VANIEILTIGDELVEGRLVDTNAPWLSARLVEAGFQVTHHQSIPDDRDMIIAALRSSAARADALLVSGGLGPTSDDITAEAAARAFDRVLELNQEALDHVVSLFARMGRRMTSNNKKQAWLPAGTTLIPNGRGTATGFCLEGEGTPIYFLPGVPHELEAMFERFVLKALRERFNPEHTLVSSLHTFGLGESKVGSLLEPLTVPSPGRLRVQYRAALPEVHVRLCLSGFDEGDPAGLRTLETVAEEAASRLGRAVFSRQEESLAQTVIRLLKSRGETVATAESCTGGLLGATLTEVPGASAVFMGGIVSYDNRVKRQQLGVPDQLLEQYGAVSEPVTRVLAEQARRRLETTYALAITGIAGPGGGTPNKPIGTVCLGIAAPRGVSTRTVRFPGDRNRVRLFSAYAALEMLRRALIELESSDTGQD